MAWSRIKAGLAASCLLSIAGFGLRASSNRSADFSATQATAASAPAQEAQPNNPEPTPPAQGSEAPAPPPAPPFFVIIDPAHGGTDQGALLSPKLAEKDVNLALGRRLKSELHERGIQSRLLRDSDVTLSLDQRAESANEQHAAVYLSLHAGVPGEGVRVYAPALTATETLGLSRFVPWELAQANSLPRSQGLAQKIALELNARNVTAVSLASPIRPLNNVIAPAVAVEVTPAPDDVSGLMAQKFQTTVAAAIAAAIVQLRPELETRQ
jgi:N-acetylmuramoyl-L-alanine amidase